MKRLELVHEPRYLVLPGQDSGPEVVRPLFLAKPGAWDGDDAGLIQQLEGVPDVRGLAGLLGRLERPRRQPYAGEGVHRALGVRGSGAVVVGVC